jgi:hypothetical protein
MKEIRRMGLSRTWVFLLTGVLLWIGTAGATAQDVKPTEGELRIEGTGVSRLILVRQDDQQEQLSNLSGSIRLPVGTYRVQQIDLQGGYSGLLTRTDNLQRIVISPNEPAVLKVGGPLRQAVKADRHGPVLVLNYELTGIGGEMYIAPGTPLAQPSFAIYRGDRLIASGQFEYG